MLMPPKNNMPKSLKPTTQSVIADAQRFGDPTVQEGICPLCGRYMALNNAGYCGTEECSEAILDFARRERPEAITMFGSVRVLLLGKLHRYAEPIPPESLNLSKDDGVCEYADCSNFARPRDTLCNQHRCENPKAKNNHGKSRNVLKNRIKGLDKIKPKRKGK
jgi:hypothetical protein